MWPDFVLLKQIWIGSGYSKAPRLLPTIILFQAVWCHIIYTIFHVWNSLLGIVLLFYFNKCSTSNTVLYIEAKINYIHLYFAQKIELLTHFSSTSTKSNYHTLLKQIGYHLIFSSNCFFQVWYNKQAKFQFNRNLAVCNLKQLQYGNS